MVSMSALCAEGPGFTPQVEPWTVPQVQVHLGRPTLVSCLNYCHAQPGLCLLDRYLFKTPIYWATCCVKCFTSTITFNTHNNPIRYELPPSPSANDPSFLSTGKNEDINIRLPNFPLLHLKVSLDLQLLHFLYLNYENMSNRQKQ